MRYSSQQAREFFRKDPLWAEVRGELTERLAETRRLCSALDDELELRRYQGEARLIERLLNGGLEAPILERLVAQESGETL